MSLQIYQGHSLGFYIRGGHRVLGACECGDVHEVGVPFQFPVSECVHIKPCTASAPLAASAQISCMLSPFQLTAQSWRRTVTYCLCPELVHAKPMSFDTGDYGGLQ